jgi:hypothetical protein
MSDHTPPTAAELADILAKTVSAITVTELYQLVAAIKARPSGSQPTTTLAVALA